MIEVNKSSRARIPFNLSSAIKVCFLLYFATVGITTGVDFLDSWVNSFGFLFMAAFGILYIAKFKKGKIVRGYFTWLIMFILLYYISIIWSKNADDLLYYSYRSYFFQIAVIAFVVENDINNKKDIEDYLRIILLSTIYMIIILLFNTPLNEWGTERLGESIGMNSNSVGMRIAFSIVILFYFAEKKKALYVLSIPLAIVGLFSGSRKSLFMMLLGIVVFLIVGKETNKKIRNILISLLIVSFILYEVMNNPVLYGVLGHRVQNALNFMTDTGNVTGENSIIERSFYRKTAMQMFWERPLLGWGGNGFVTRMRDMNYSHVAYSHCNYTEMFADLGLVGFILYYSLQARILINAFKNRWNDRIYIVALSITIANLFGEYFYVSYIDVYTQTILLLMFIISRFQVTNEQSDLEMIYEIN